MSNRSITGARPASLSVPASALLIASPSYAQTRRDLGTHQHGAATLDVVLDGDQLLIDLAGPAADVLGFGHEPTTDAQRATVEDARLALADGTLLATDPGADCRERIEVQLAGPGGQSSTVLDADAPSIDLGAIR